MAVIRAHAGRHADIRRVNVNHNLALVAKLATDYGASLICLGEAFPCPYFATVDFTDWSQADQAEWKRFWNEMGEPLTNSETLRAMQLAARQYGVRLIVPFIEKGATSGKSAGSDSDVLYNSLVHIDEAGQVLQRYRKHHVPHGSNEQGCFVEGEFFARGDERQLLSASERHQCNAWLQCGRRSGTRRSRTRNNRDADRSQRNPHYPVERTRDGVPYAAFICYDRHFPYVNDEAAAAGALLAFYPSITFGAAAHQVWLPEVQAWAQENGIYVVLSNRTGQEPPFSGEATFFGDPCVAAPDGHRLPNLAEPRDTSVAVFDLELAKSTPRATWDERRMQKWRQELQGNAGAVVDTQGHSSGWSLWDHARPATVRTRL